MTSVLASRKLYQLGNNLGYKKLQWLKSTRNFSHSPPRGRCFVQAHIVQGLTLLLACCSTISGKASSTATVFQATEGKKKNSGQQVVSLQGCAAQVTHGYSAPLVLLGRSKSQGHRLLQRELRDVSCSWEAACSAENGQGRGRVVSSITRSKKGRMGSGNNAQSLTQCGFSFVALIGSSKVQ